MRTYGRLLARPATAVSLLAALLSAVPIGMWPLAVVLLALDRGGSAADAGLLAALFGIGNAAGIAAQGALLIRARDSVLLPAFAAAGIAAAALLALGTPGDPAARIGALLAGLAIPAVTPAVRGRFAAVLPGVDRPGAYALVNVLFQAGIAVGPILAATLAGAGLVTVAPAVAATFGFVAAVALAIAHRRAVRPPSAAVPARGGGAGSLPGIGVLFGCAAAGGFGIGALQVLVPLRSGAAVSGAAFAALALAEVVGAVLLGAAIRAGSAAALIVGGTVTMAVVDLGVAGAALPTVVLLSLLGLATSTQSIGSALLLDRFVGPGRLPVVFATQIALLVTASAVGAFTAGVAPSAAMPVAAAALAVAALAAGLTLLHPHRLRAAAR